MNFCKKDTTVNNLDVSSYCFGRQIELAAIVLDSKQNNIFIIYVYRPPPNCDMFFENLTVFNNNSNKQMFWKVSTLI